jgi:hypothetical protein
MFDADRAAIVRPLCPPHLETAGVPRGAARVGDAVPARCPARSCTAGSGRGRAARSHGGRGRADRRQLPFSATLTADIIEDDSARTGLRREATYYGAQNLVEKTATSLAPLFLVTLLLLGDTSDDTLGIRLIGPAAGVIASSAT